MGVWRRFAPYGLGWSLFRKPTGVLMRLISMTCWRSGRFRGSPKLRPAALRRRLPRAPVRPGADRRFLERHRHRVARRLEISAWSEHLFDVPVRVALVAK